MSYLLEEKQMAKEILVEMIKRDAFSRSEYPNAKTITDMYCTAYKEILNTISQDE